MLLEQVEVVQRKEAFLKARLVTWLDEAYVISATREVGELTEDTVEGKGR